jgi:hypothetical protein
MTGLEGCLKKVVSFDTDGHCELLDDCDDLQSRAGHMAEELVRTS